MKNTTRIASLILCFFLIMSGQIPAQEKEETTAPKPLENISDIMAWKTIGSSILSKNGEWFGYNLSPLEGDGKVIFRQTQGDKEYTFDAGEAGLYSRGATILFSEDARWAAFSIQPTIKEAQALKKQKKRSTNKMALVDLSTGEKTEFEQVRSFAFSNENPGWLAMHKYAPDSQEKSQDKWSGSDLILYEIATKTSLTIGNVAEFAFDKKGTRLVWIVDASDPSSNGVQMRDMKTGVITVLDTGKAWYKSLNWNKKGEALSVLRGVENDAYKDKMYKVVAWKGFSTGKIEKTSFCHKKLKLDEGWGISPNRAPEWTDDLDGVLFGIHEVEMKEAEEKKEGEDITKKAPAAETEKDKNENVKKEEEKEPPSKIKEKEIPKDKLPGLVIWHWKDSRMQSQQQVQERRDKNFSFLCLYLVKDNRLVRLADQDLRTVYPAPKHRWAIGQDNSPYELMSNLDGRNYQDIYVIDMKTGERKMALEKCRWFFGPSPTGTHFLYYEDGHFMVYDMASGTSVNITKDVPTSFINTEDDHNVVDPPVYPRFGWTKDGKSVLLSDNWDIWQVPIKGGQGVNLTVNGKKEALRYQFRYRLDPDEEGIDFSQPMYLRTYGEWTKKGGISVISKGKPGAKPLLWDDALFSLRKAEKADIYLYTRQTFKDYPDYYAAGPDLKNGTRITDANPQQKDFLWSSGTRLIDYKSDKGDRLQAALFLPANYEEGKSYPTMVYFYEKSSQNLNRYYTPSARGFDKSVYTSRGYAVLMPDIVYTVDDPGMSAVWCVLPALKAAIATGIVDKDHVGVHGHSWGGYQSSFLITQTDMFAACVTGAPLTNMISMYSSIYWNSGSANQPIFESSQGRFTGGYWENQDAYIRNSPVFFADKVTTPTIILHNDADGAVDWNQGIEYFNTLRRLGKPVVMLQYKGENHGLRKIPNQKDYTIRMREFFDHFLMGKPAPEWWMKGVSHLDLEDHIKDTTKKIK